MHGAAGLDGVVQLAGIEQQLAADNLVLGLLVAADRDAPETRLRAFVEHEAEDDVGGLLDEVAARVDLGGDVADLPVQVLDMLDILLQDLVAQELVGAELDLRAQPVGVEDLVALEGDFLDLVALALLDHEHQVEVLALDRVELEAEAGAGVEVPLVVVEALQRQGVAVGLVLVQRALAEDPDVRLRLDLRAQAGCGKRPVALEQDVADTDPRALVDPVDHATLGLERRLVDRHLDVVIPLLLVLLEDVLARLVDLVAVERRPRHGRQLVQLGVRELLVPLELDRDDLGLLLQGEDDDRRALLDARAGVGGDELPRPQQLANVGLDVLLHEGLVRARLEQPPDVGFADAVEAFEVHALDLHPLGGGARLLRE